MGWQGQVTGPRLRRFEVDVLFLAENRSNTQTEERTIRQLQISSVADVSGLCGVVDFFSGCDLCGQFLGIFEPSNEITLSARM